MRKICAIVISYQTDLDQLERCFTAIARQVDHVVVVDNSSDVTVSEFVTASSEDVATYIDPGSNTGVAHALNLGISKSKELDASHVVFFDQDSIPEDGMIEILVDAIDKLEMNHRVASVGPQYLDVKGERVRPFKLSGLMLRQIACRPGHVERVDHLISSGCMAPISVFDEVGMMEESLFIDYVDVEWCLRARHLGYHSFGVCDAVMIHDMGERFVKVLGQTANAHSPLRNYYMVRNGIWLIRCPWLGFKRSLVEFLKIMKKFVVYSLFIGSNLDNVKMMSKGFMHGVIGRMGEHNDKDS